jgi:hypothetical protein
LVMVRKRVELAPIGKMAGETVTSGMIRLLD